MIIRTNAKENRKELIHTLTEVLREKPRYCGAPSFAYQFSLCRVDRDASLHLPPTLVLQSAQSVVTLLNQRGFEAEIADEASESETPTEQPEGNSPAEQPEEVNPAEQFHTVYVPHERISGETLAKLEQVISSKATLLRKALGDSTLSITSTPNGYAFPWFQIESNEESRRAYATLVDKLIAFAQERTRVTASDRETDNPRYAFRCFLLRLGFIGAEYKCERAVLLRNLEGNGAFRSGSDPRKNPA